MSRALLVPSWVRSAKDLPTLSGTWHGHLVAGESLDLFLTLTGLAASSPYWSILYPLVVGFRLQMALLTHPKFPFPIWTALQIRNRAVLHRPFGRGTALDLHSYVQARRGSEKGTEVDLRTRAYTAGEMIWECVNTFYYRGIRNECEEHFTVPLAPAVAGPVVAHWVAPVAPRWSFGKLTGDYNGIHLSSWYARLFGFRDAFLHPQRVLGQCAAHLPQQAISLPMQLNVWLKGPVYYGSQVTLRAQQIDGATDFAVQVGGEERAAIIGAFSNAAAAHANAI